MVMKRNAMAKNIRQSIVRSFGRYIAIAAIIALGAGLFAGLLMTKADMVATGQSFTDQQNMFDIRVLGSYGWSQTYVEAFAALDGIADAEGMISMDLIAKTGEHGEENVYRFYSIPERINQVSLRMGRMPMAPDECLADGYHGNRKLLGKTVYLADSNDSDSLESLNYRAFRIVGLVATPLYMDMNRGTTSVGNGSLTNYYYVPRDAFNIDYYTEIDLTISGDYEIYSDTYNDALEEMMDWLEPEAERLNQDRYETVKTDAQQAYADGYQEWLEGMQEYLDGKQEAAQELEDALQKLLDGEVELEESRLKLEDAQQAFEDGKQQLENGKSQLSSAKAQYEAQKTDADYQLRKARAELDRQQTALEPAYNAAYIALPIAQKTVESLQKRINDLDESNPAQQIIIQVLKEQLKTAQDTVDSLQQVVDGMSAIQSGYSQIAEKQQQLIEAGQQLTAAESSITANEAKLREAEKELKEGWKEWHKGEQELSDGWAEYEEGKQEAEQKLRQAAQELEDGKEQLLDARKKLSNLEQPELFLLDRNSNIGYINLSSNSDIVAGISRVFPAFFLLVAALVCITTMTRMIEEERTQIGTLKALGYSNAAIIGKYIIYSGSGGILGCSLGLWAGCTIFPQVIWQAYCIMMYIQPSVVLTVNWPLCGAIILAYSALMVLVTWYCCFKTLQEEPASLIRPKSPEAGKKILLEYLPFWKRVSFLNKVTIRNIFRYRQRLAMMLVGIGGCTALLVTGFGLRDSIVNIMDIQFENVTHYDLCVYFRQENTPEEAEEFQQIVQENGRDWMSYHQSSVDLNFNDRVKGIYMICADENVTRYIHMEQGGQDLAMPQIGEAVLSVGVAEAMGIQTGDRVILRGADLRTLEVTVSGIYDNYVYNYAIVLPETVEAQWGASPEKQMAFVSVEDGQDVYALTARLTGLDNVINIMVSEDMAAMVRGMMDALDLVVWVVLFCAGLLAVTVLYNLTNININERIREIATIKVLGFNAGETAAYVFKENFVLTIVGSIFGLGLGKLLLGFVISQVRIDMVWFKAVALPASYGWSVALTLLAAIGVSFVFFFRLDKINMAEALKSVE